VSPGLIIAAALVLAAVGSLVFWRQPVLAFARGAAVYLGEVRVELRKVSWPTWEDLRKSTGVIIIFVILVGIIIGIMDFVFSKLLIDVLGRAFG
jgi:preprotein translocase subunit SecE